MTRIPAEYVIQLDRALTQAMKLASAQNDNALWTDLMESRSTVRAYLIKRMPPVEVEVGVQVAATKEAA